MKSPKLIVMLILLAGAAGLVAYGHANTLGIRDFPSLETSFIPAFGQGQTPNPAAPKEQPVEQVRKNIKVLTGMPESQLIPVMTFFETSLGVKCEHCHVLKGRDWDFVTDEKLEKNMARTMIRMVLDLNKASFNGAPTVSCYTCHHGKTSPQGFPLLPLPIPSPRPAPATPSPSPSSTPPLPSADDLLNRFVDALGGQAAIDNIKSRVAKGSLIRVGDSTKLLFEIQQVPGKLYQSVTAQGQTIEIGFNGAVGWQKFGGQVSQLVGNRWADIKEAAQFEFMMDPRGTLGAMRVTGRARIGSRAAFVVTGTDTNGRRESLYFDAEDGLLLRRIIYKPTMIGILPIQVDLEDYRLIDGVKFPFLWRVSSIDSGSPEADRKFEEIKSNVPIDAARFDQPPAPPKATPQATPR